MFLERHVCPCYMKDSHLACSNQESSYRRHPMLLPETPSAPADNSDFQSIFDEAVKEYNKKTNGNITSDPLLVELGSCTSVDDILAVFHRRDEDLRAPRCNLERFLIPILNVLCKVSPIIVDGVGLVFPPAKAPADFICAGIGILLSAAKGVHTYRKALADLFSRIRHFFARLEVHTKTEIPLTMAMKRIFIEIMTEVLSILAIATKEIKRPVTIIYLKRLIKNKDIKDSLQKLDTLTQAESSMAQAEIHSITLNVQRNQLRDRLRTWLSPPDPSQNHNLACRAHNEWTSQWLFQNTIFNKWKSTGSSSLLWLYGKRGSGKTVICSTIIEDIMALRDAGRAYVSYFYFDSRDTTKRSYQDLLHSLLFQLSAQSNHSFDTLSRLHSKHDHGTRLPSDDAMMECLKDMLSTADPNSTYIIVDALDQCPHTSGITSPRGHVLNLLKKLVELHLPNLYVCVTSRPEVDIRLVLEPLTPNRLSLHGGNGKIMKSFLRLPRLLVYGRAKRGLQRRKQVVTR
ncbi:hypothetical protein BGW80DRAFT_147174 [Lactifluus volemus]|nr:hypothetical protein BGW80DRAFT_147174 [Lactifluus volemus]